ncbi:hypothetical protein Tco_0267411 [Tanacetum coccineum]
MVLHYYYFSTSFCGLRVSDSNGLALGSSMFILIVTFLPRLVAGLVWQNGVVCGSSARLAVIRENLRPGIQSTVMGWIKEAVNRNVKSLDLMFCPKSQYTCVSAVVFPKWLVTCDTLEVLRLNLYAWASLILAGCTELRIIGRVRISSPKLKTLIIRNWKNTIYRLQGCMLWICCPELVSFEFEFDCTYERYVLILENINSLKKAVILPDDKMHHSISHGMGDNICKVLAKLSRVESLSINLYFIQEHLTTEYWTFDEAETSRIFTCHLKKVKFLGINGKKRKLVIARCLLEHGNALEEMVFSWRSKVKYHEKSMKMMNKMSKFYKASSTIKLISVLKD